MRFVLMCGIGALTLLAGMSFEATARADAASPHRQVLKRKRHSVETVDSLKDLRAAHKLLNEADHDYEGHRALAAEEVHKAVKILEDKEPGKDDHPGQGAKAAGKHPKEKEHVQQSQAASDAQLHQALEILQRVNEHLPSHHPKAAENVAKAIAEVKTALKVK